ncbi:MAG: CoA-disulfide reductase [Streptosporangiales bacterium]|nr:CoA-disulfide reductase [Streptosporangiales bacterium]
MTRLVIIGGSDAGISAGLRARELDPSMETTLVVADAYPNFSICGIPYYVSGDVTDWRHLAHRTRHDLENAGLDLLLDHTAHRIDSAAKTVTVTGPAGDEQLLGYDQLVIGTGAIPVRPPIRGLAELGPADGVHVLHTMGDTFAVMESLERRQPRTALVVGAGYIGLEMAEALTARGIRVTQVEQLPEVLPTVDPELGALVCAELTGHGVDVVTGTRVTDITREGNRLHVDGDHYFTRDVDLVLVVGGVAPDTALAETAGVSLDVRGAIVVDEHMRTGVPDVYAAGDCVVTHHRLLGTTYLPLGTTAHKQGRVAGENAVGGDRAFAGSLGTQVVKVFDLAVARTGLRDHEARTVGFAPVTVGSVADDHKAYYPGAQPITARVTGDAETGKLLGAQLVGPIPTAVAKRIDTFATALFAGLDVDTVAELDLSYTPPLGSPWDAVQMATQAWVRDHLETEAALPESVANVPG